MLNIFFFQAFQAIALLGTAVYQIILAYPPMIAMFVSASTEFMKAATTRLILPVPFVMQIRVTSELMQQPEGFPSA